MTKEREIIETLLDAHVAFEHGDDALHDELYAKAIADAHEYLTATSGSELPLETVEFAGYKEEGKPEVTTKHVDDTDVVESKISTYGDICRTAIDEDALAVAVSVGGMPYVHTKRIIKAYESARKPLMAGVLSEILDIMNYHINDSLGMEEATQAIIARLKELGGL